jgi:hypothetical protein
MTCPLLEQKKEKKIWFGGRENGYKTCSEGESGQPLPLLPIGKDWKTNTAFLLREDGLGLRDTAWCTGVESYKQGFLYISCEHGVRTRASSLWQHKVVLGD